MTTYNEAVTEARTLVRRSEDDQWRLAELTWEQVEAGKSRAQWAKDISVTRSHANRLYLIWARWGEYRVPDRPSFAEAYASLKAGVNPEDASAFLEDQRSLSTIRKASPERKAEVARELLSDPEVTQAVVADRDAGTAIFKAQTQRVQDERERVARKRAANPDPVREQLDEQIALHDLQLAINGFVRKANDLLQQVGVVPASERHWLNGEAERLEAVTQQVRYLADHGETRTDAELRALTGGS